ncbi:MAG: hypothetical protein U1F83_12190 [Verrucomicrobiota bacterium]
MPKPQTFRVTTTLRHRRFSRDAPALAALAGMHGAFANWAVNGEYEKRKTFNDPMVKLKDGADLLLGVQSTLRRPRDRQVRGVLASTH